MLTRLIKVNEYKETDGPIYMNELTTSQNTDLNERNAKKTKTVTYFIKYTR